MKLKITTFLLGLILMAGNSFAQWQKTNGPSEAQATTIEQHNGNYYLGTGSAGLFTSGSMGGAWTPVSTFQDTGAAKYITKIINHNDSLYVATYSGGIFKSSDNALTWQKTTSFSDTFFNYNIYQANNQLFATIFTLDWSNYQEYTRLYHLDDATGLWVEMPNLPQDVVIYDIAALHDTIYCAIPGHGLYNTSNYGASWDSSTTAFGVINTNYVRTVAAYGQKIYAVGYTTTNELLSSSDGVNWQYASVTQLGGDVVTTMSVQGDTVILAASGALAYSYDGGTNWRYSFFPDYSVNQIKTINAQTILTDQTMGVLYSVNDSVWTPANNGLFYANTMHLAKPFTTLFALDNNNTFTSATHGDAWSIYPTFPWVDTTLLWNVHDIVRTGNKLLAFTQYGQSNVISWDQGQSWANDTGAGVNIQVQKTLVNNDTRTIYAQGMYDIRRSDDYGKSWKSLFYADGNTPHDTSFTSITQIGNRLFITAQDTSSILLYSDDKGNTWHRSHTSSAVYHVEAVLDTLVISSGNGLEQSVDLGNTFTIISPSGLLNTTYVNGHTLFNYEPFNALGDITYSTDCGLTWTNISINPDSTGAINNLLMDDTYLYAATQQGSVWRRTLTDLGMTYTPDTTNNYNVGVQHVSKNTDGKVMVFPNPYNEQSTIAITTAATHSILVRVFDVTGRLIKTIAQGNYPSGVHTFTLQQDIPSGIYLLVTNIDDMSVTRKIIKQ